MAETPNPDAPVVEKPVVVETPAPGATPPPAMSDLSADDWMAVRNGEKKLEDLQATPKAEPTAEEQATADAAATDAAKLLAERKKKPLAPRLDSIQGQIDALTRQKGDSQRERDQIATEVAELRAEKEALLAGRDPKPKVEPPPKPDAAAEAAAKKAADEAALLAAVGAKPTWAKYEADGKTYEEFMDARDDWSDARTQFFLKRHTEESQAAERDRIERARAARAAAEHDAALTARLDKFKEQHADVDLDALLTTEIPGFNAEKRGPGYETIALFTQHEDDGLEVLLYFGEHPEEAAKIVAMPPGRALMALGALRERIGGAAHSGPASRPPQVPRLDAPIKPVRAASTPPKVPLAQTTVDDFIERRNAAERGTA